MGFAGAAVRRPRGCRGGAEFTPRPPVAGYASQAYRLALNELRPEFPPGYDANYYGGRFGYRRSYYWNNIDANLPAPSCERSLLERVLQESLPDSLRQLPPRSYVAIAPQAPESLLGYPAPREEGSFHVMVGTW